MVISASMQRVVVTCRMRVLAWHAVNVAHGQQHLIDGAEVAL
jgi:hypothetical protein